MSRTIVVGAGLSGLVRAYRLLRAGQDVLLLEASDRAGGVVRSEEVDGFLLELGPNTVRPTPEIWSLLAELGLQDQALLSDPRAPRYIDFGGRLHPLPMSPRALLRTSLLSTRGKLRLAAEPFIKRAENSAESVRSFVARRLGPEVAERLVEPFVSGIFAGDGSRLSASACFPKLALWEREDGSLARGAIRDRRRARGQGPPVRGLLSFREGLDTLPRALGKRLGKSLKTQTRVDEIVRVDDSWVIGGSGEEFPASRVIVATPARQAARLVEPFAPQAASALSTIPHPPLAVLHLAWPVSAFPKEPQGFGHLVVPGPERRILGAVYSSSLFEGRAPRGQVLLTVFAGGARDPETPGASDAELVEIVSRDLAAALGVRGAPRILRVTRYAGVLPQYDFQHESRMRVLAQAEERWRGLSFLGNYRGGVSVGDVVRNATPPAGLASDIS
ncbi:MAG TPA: protoporphyrinogen oxidase [Thermoanaerobaculia bacterium]|nr:protoporphyrinogen oxidase [Thermoanaerobaculia bacterium]